jgi:hypothetical protein
VLIPQAIFPVPEAKESAPPIGLLDKPKNKPGVLAS